MTVGGWSDWEGAPLISQKWNHVTPTQKNDAQRSSMHLIPLTVEKVGSNFGAIKEWGSTCGESGYQKQSTTKCQKSQKNCLNKKGGQNERSKSKPNLFDARISY